MQLWMICPWQTLETLRAASELHCKPLHQDRQGKLAYDWMRALMRRRICGYKGPSMWWAWHTIHGIQSSRPDLRSRRWHWDPPGSTWARIGIDVPEEEVLLSEFHLWHAPLNRTYCSYNEAEHDEWWARHPESGHTYSINRGCAR